MTASEELGHLGDIPVSIAVELDRRTMTMGEILALDTGSVVEMRRSAGENVDVLVEGAVIGCGEIVIIEETMGIRLTDFSGDR
ncbi:MAG: FliM/FliN family flagellar motor switch protein [Bryobacterales bacterium]|nr:FliM/FliN family flagellar motor switch protein [Bryobacterales bacterium]